MCIRDSLYTGTGDNGTTSLVGGQRVSKISVRLQAYGTLDEFSSFLGVAAASAGCPQRLKEIFSDIQNRLFDIGCYLATAPSADGDSKCSATDEAGVAQMERCIDDIDADTPKIRAFVLPGGSIEAAHCHVARSVCRRAEIRILELAQTEYVDPLLLRWVNRLSDLLFIAARYCNHQARVDEIVWKPISSK